MYFNLKSSEIAARNVFAAAVTLLGFLPTLALSKSIIVGFFCGETIK